MNTEAHILSKILNDKEVKYIADRIEFDMLHKVITNTEKKDVINRKSLSPKDFLKRGAYRPKDEDEEKIAKALYLIQRRNEHIQTMRNNQVYTLVYVVVELTYRYYTNPEYPDNVGNIFIAYKLIDQF